ncbi:hypothetical protein F0L68_04680 [Solihabitans fulvus]|uniref:Uncharacterized protein n=1 Tax=Solihabitans fulvus TaxID=1892852 RepID=A0A5B2XNQ7_9PSEU|nr:hypothetical protein F0L68_04680 [Solihabitans fulvus]
MSHNCFRAAYVARVRPEDGGGDYGPNSGGYDQLGFGTLAHTLGRSVSTCPRSRRRIRRSGSRRCLSR